MSRGNVLLEAENFEAVNEEKVSEETKEKSNTEDGVYVKGMALPFGTPSRNGVQYEKKSVKEAHEDLVGRTILFNHKQDWVTGHILNTEITEDGMFFEGDINPNAEMPNGVPVAEAIERGDINSVSIQAFIEQLGEEADEEAIVNDMETEKVAVKDFLEISAVSIPGFPQAEALPEHLQSQGVQPVTEMIGAENLQKSTESLENPEYEVSDFVEWEFGDGESQGEIIERETEPGESMSAGGNEFTVDEEDDEPLYKIEEWDETAGDDGEFTNNVVKFEDALSSTDRPEAAEQRKAEPFAGYDSFEDCVQDNQDKSDPEAYCGEIKDRAEEVKAKYEALSDVDLTPPEKVVNAAELALEKDEELDTDCGTGVGSSRANSISNNTLSPEDFLGGENTAIPDYLDSHEEDVTAEGVPTDWSDEEWSDCGNLQYAKWGYYLEWFQDKQEELQQAKENVLGEDQPMTNNDNQDSMENENVKSEQVSQEAFIEFVAEHMEGLDADDVASAVGDSNFTGLDQGEVAKLLAMEFELDTDTVMDAIGQLEDMEGEGYDGKDDDDEDDDMDESEEESEQESEEEGERSRSELKERIDELEERLETLVKEDEGKSKQESPISGSGESSSVPRNPSFKDAL